MKDLVDIVTDYDEKVGNMNATVLAVRDAESASYAHYMAKMLTASDSQREENRKLAEIRNNRHGIDPTAQQPSTQAIMARPKEDDEKHFLRPLPKEVIEQSARMSQAINQFREEHKDLPQAAIQELECPGMKEMVGERQVSDAQESHVQSVRYRSKNTKGQSEKSGSGEERKEAATHAYLCSGPAILTDEEKQRITQIAPYTEIPPLPIEEKPQTIASRISHWLWKRGVPVQRTTKKELKVD